MWLIIWKLLIFCILFYAIVKLVSSHIQLGSEQRAGVITGISEKEKREGYREELLFHVIISAMGIGFAVWFVLWKISNAVGICMPDLASLAIIYSASLIAGIALNNYWNPYDPEEVFREIALEG